jgi:hypothetical protein
MFFYPFFLRLYCRGLCSGVGRGIPNLAAQALRFIFTVDDSDKVHAAEGTSYATPVYLPLSSALRRPSLSTQLTDNVQAVACMISLLNDCLLSMGRKPLGSVDPWQPRRGGVNVIISRSNTGCGTDVFLTIAEMDVILLYSLQRGSPVFQFG